MDDVLSLYTEAIRVGWTRAGVGGYSYGKWESRVHEAGGSDPLSQEPFLNLDLFHSTIWVIIVSHCRRCCKNSTTLTKTLLITSKCKTLEPHRIKGKHIERLYRQ